MCVSCGECSRECAVRSIRRRVEPERTGDMMKTGCLSSRSVDRSSADGRRYTGVGRLADFAGAAFGCLGAAGALCTWRPVVAVSADFRFLVPTVGLSVIAKAGTAIAQDGDRVWTTPYDDAVLVMPGTRNLKPGGTAVRLGRFEA